MGMVCATSLCDRIIQSFQPRCVIMSGICAGRKGAVKLGDVIVANQAWDYGSGSIQTNNNKTEFEPAPDYKPFNIVNENCFDFYEDTLSQLKEKIYNAAIAVKDFELAKIADEEAHRTTKIYQGAMASGAAVIKSEQFTNKYIKRQNRKYCGIDMETYGVYYAAAKSRNSDAIQYFSIKCVSDLADAHKGDVFQAYCASLSAEIVFKYIQEDMVI